MTPKLKINTRENISKRNEEIVSMYFNWENNVFKGSAKNIREKYNLTQIELNTIVDSNSKNYLELGKCEKCLNEIKLSVRTRSQITEIINSPFFLCSECNELINKDVDKYSLYIDKFKAKMEYALEFKTFKKLKKDELGFLKEIIRIDNYEKLHKFYVRKNHSYYNNILDKLERLCLIKRIRGNDNYYSENIREIYFLPKLRQELDYDINKAINEKELNFYLPRRLNKPNSKSPNFSKKIIFESNITIKKDVEYICSIWVNSDGGLDFGLKELSEIKNNKK